MKLYEYDLKGGKIGNSIRQPEKDRERERETEQESYMQLELLQVYLIFVAQLSSARSMHILIFNNKYKRCL